MATHSGHYAGARAGQHGGPASSSAGGDEQPLPHHLLTLATLRLLTIHPESRFTHVRQVPLDILSELTARYLELLAGAAKRFAEQSGRTAASARDVVDAISEFGVNPPEIWEWCEERRLGGEGVQMAASGPVDPAALGELIKSESALRSRLRLWSSEALMQPHLAHCDTPSYSSFRCSTARHIAVRPTQYARGKDIHCSDNGPGHISGRLDYPRATIGLALNLSQASTHLDKRRPAFIPSAGTRPRCQPGSSDRCRRRVWPDRQASEKDSRGWRRGVAESCAICRLDTGGWRQPCAS